MILPFVRQAQKGEEAAFEQLVLRTRDLVSSIAYSILGHRSQEDAVQECYLVVLRRLGQLKNVEAFIAWLSRIALHEAYRVYRKNSRAAELPEVEPRGEDQVQDVVESLTLRIALGKLSQNDRDVLILYELVGLTHSEIAFALRIPEGTARSRLHTARKKLASVLQP